MQPLTFYLLKVIACPGVMLLYYCMALRNKRFHYYNRFYLLVTVAASLLLPLTLPNWFTVKSSNSNTVALINILGGTGGGVQVKPGPRISLPVVSKQAMLFLVYCCISVLLLAIVLRSIVLIYAVKRKFGFTSTPEFDFINTNLPQAPFSFLQNLFWRSDIDINGAAGRHAMLHELTHIRQKHSWDKLCMQVVTALYWINPFFWFIQKELCMLHEFIADEKAIENNDGAAFAAMLLTSKFGENILFPGHQFYSSPIKRRLFMFTNVNNPSYSYLRRLLLLPLLALMVILCAFGLQKENEPKHNPAQTGAAAAVDDDSTKAQPLYILNGVIVAKSAIDTLKINNIETVNVLKGKASPDKYGSAGVDGAIAVTTKNNKDTARSFPIYLFDGKTADTGRINWNATKKNNRLGVAPIKDTGIVNTSKDKKHAGDTTGNAKVGTERLLLAYNKNYPVGLRPSPLYILDGKVIDDAAFTIIDKNTIASVTVLKGTSATALYGEKGVNGVVIIITKPNKNLGKPKFGLKPALLHVVE